MSEVKLRWGVSHSKLEKVMQSDLVTDRNKNITNRALRGDTFLKIGADHGITRERVRQITLRSIDAVDVARGWGRILRAKSIGISKFEYLFDMELNVRSNNCIMNAGFSKDELLISISTKEGQRKMLSIPNFGRKSLKEVCKTLGVDVMI